MVLKHIGHGVTLDSQTRLPHKREMQGPSLTGLTIILSYILLQCYQVCGHNHLQTS
jgi:hypothetical protein